MNTQKIKSPIILIALLITALLISTFSGKCQTSTINIQTNGTVVNSTSPITFTNQIVNFSKGAIINNLTVFDTNKNLAVLVNPTTRQLIGTNGSTVTVDWQSLGLFGAWTLNGTPLSGGGGGTPLGAWTNTSIFSAGGSNFISADVSHAEVANGTNAAIGGASNMVFNGVNTYNGAQTFTTANINAGNITPTGGTAATTNDVRALNLTNNANIFNGKFGGAGGLWLTNLPVVVTLSQLLNSKGDADIEEECTNQGSIDWWPQIQAILSKATNGPLRVIWDGGYGVSRSLVLPSNLTIEAYTGCGAILWSNSFMPLFRNLHPSTNGIVDNNIIIDGGTWNYNGSTIVRSFPATNGWLGGWLHGMEFIGVNNIKIKNANLYNNSAFSVWMQSCSNIICDNLQVYTLTNSATSPYPYSYDGLHFNACQVVTVADSTFQVNDDAIAFLANETYTPNYWIAPVNFTSPWWADGDCKHIEIRNVTMIRSRWNSIRLASGTNGISDVKIDGVHGSVYYGNFIMDNLAEYPLLSPGNGYYTNILIRNVDCNVLSNGYKHCAFSIGASFNSLTIQDVTRKDWTATGGCKQTFLFNTNTVCNSFTLDRYKSFANIINGIDAQQLTFCGFFGAINLNSCIFSGTNLTIYPIWFTNCAYTYFSDSGTIESGYASLYPTTGSTPTPVGITNATSIRLNIDGQGYSHFELSSPGDAFNFDNISIGNGGAGTNFVGWAMSMAKSPMYHLVTYFTPPNTGGYTLVQDLSGTNANFPLDMAIGGKCSIGGATSIGGTLSLIVNTTVDSMSIRNINTAGYSTIGFYNATGSELGGVGYGNTSASAPYASGMYVAAIGATSLNFITGNTKRAAFDSSGNFTLSCFFSCATNIAPNQVLQGNVSVTGTITGNGVGITNVQASALPYRAGMFTIAAATTSIGITFSTPFPPGTGYSINCTLTNAPSAAASLYVTSETTNGCTINILGASTGEGGNYTAQPFN